jgi:hypothetical protein
MKPLTIWITGLQAKHLGSKSILVPLATSIVETLTPTGTAVEEI